MTKNSSTDTLKAEARLQPLCRTKHQILDAELQQNVKHFDYHKKREGDNWKGRERTTVECMLFRLL